ncbi:MAG: glycosyl transferase family 2, partial [Prevotella salivae]|nr:glycosyl transferase family 2 [Segatella salivae]
MIIDTITLIIGLSITLTTILALLLTPFWHKTKALPAAHSNTPLPEVSILIPTHDNAPELKRNLP